MGDATASGLFGWWREGDAKARTALLAASLGWMLDAFDVMLYSLVLKSLMADLRIDSSTAGWVASITLIAAAGGGLVFGVLADRLGRTRALMGTIALFSIASLGASTSQSIVQLLMWRALLPCSNLNRRIAVGASGGLFVLGTAGSRRIAGQRGAIGVRGGRVCRGNGEGGCVGLRAENVAAIPQRRRGPGRHRQGRPVDGRGRFRFVRHSRKFYCCTCKKRN